MNPWETSTATPKDRPSVGTKLTFFATAKREYDHKGHVWWRSRKNPLTLGVYIGYRLKRAGVHRMGSYDSPGYLEVTGTVSFALIATDERKNPVLVPWDALEIA